MVVIANRCDAGLARGFNCLNAKFGSGTIYLYTVLSLNSYENSVLRLYPCL